MNWLEVLEKWFPNDEVEVWDMIEEVFTIMRYFKLFWLTDEIQLIKGQKTNNQLNDLASAMNNVGIGNGALRALDYWKEISKEEWEQEIRLIAESL